MATSENCTSTSDLFPTSTAPKPAHSQAPFQLCPWADFLKQKNQMRPPGRIRMLLNSGFSLSRTELPQMSQAMAPCAQSPLLATATLPYSGGSRGRGALIAG